MTDKNGVAGVRISSQKQGLQGDSPEDQKQQIQRYADQHGIKIIKVFTFIESASGITQPLQEAIDYCKDPKNNVQCLLVKSIDRFTRGGSFQFQSLRMQLSRYNVQLIDTYGVISQEKINTLGHLGFEYPWSILRPSQQSEILEAERARDEIRTILTRMIGAEIRYVQMGYRIRPAPPGYRNVKVETPHGMRVILEPHPVESVWFIRMFELNALGSFSDQQIVDQINAMGYKSRRIRHHDRTNKSKIIGYSGEKKLTIKQMHRYIQNPIYAGINTEKWTNGIPTKENFNSLISVELFNRANRGKIMISETVDTISVTKGKVPAWQLRKQKYNPLYPYKKYVLCPVCHKPLFGSASRGKSGKQFPAYHCNRKHYFRVSVKDFEITVEKFVRNIRFSNDFLEKLQTILLEEWNKRLGLTRNEAITAGKHVTELKEQVNMITDKIKMLTNQTVIHAFEVELEKIESEMAQTIAIRDKKENDEIDTQTVINYCRYYMEHFGELLLESDDPFKKAALFGLIFETPPSYDDLINGTPCLAPLFRLNEDFNNSKSLSVSRLGLEPRTNCLKGNCSTS